MRLNQLTKAMVICYYLAKRGLSRLLGKELVYISGPITAMKPHEVNYYFRDGREYLQRGGVWSIDPYRLSKLYKGEWVDYMKLDIMLLMLADKILLVGPVPYSLESKGVRAERYIGYVVELEEVQHYDRTHE